MIFLANIVLLRWIITLPPNFEGEFLPACSHGQGRIEPPFVSTNQDRVQRKPCLRQYHPPMFAGGCPHLKRRNPGGM
jgi:hypothetical protein